MSHYMEPKDQIKHSKKPMREKEAEKKETAINGSQMELVAERPIAHTTMTQRRKEKGKVKERRAKERAKAKARGRKEKVKERKEKAKAKAESRPILTHPIPAEVFGREARPEAKAEKEKEKEKARRVKEKERKERRLVAARMRHYAVFMYRASARMVVNVNFPCFRMQT